MLGLGNGINPMDKQWNPSDLKGVKLVFHASDGVSSTDDGSGNLLVDSWMDQAGTLSNGSRIYAMQVSTKRPIWNYSYITFDGANDRLDLHEEDGTDVEITLDTSNGGWTLLAVYTSDDWSAGNEAILGDPDNSQNFFRHKPGSPNQFEIKINNTIKRFDLDTPTTLVNGNYYAILLSCLSDGTLRLSINGNVQADSETIGNTNDYKIEQLASKAGIDPLDGNIKHIIVVDRSLNGVEDLQLKDWYQQYID